MFCSQKDTLLFTWPLVRQHATMNQAYSALALNSTNGLLYFSRDTTSVIAMDPSNGNIVNKWLAGVGYAPVRLRGIWSGTVVGDGDVVVVRSVK